MPKYKLDTVKELREKTENGSHRFEVVSLFAGGGGSSTGYRMAGGRVLAVNEFIPEAIATYSANWPATKVIAGDIRQVTGRQILDLIGKNKGERKIDQRHIAIRALVITARIWVSCKGRVFKRPDFRS